MILIAKKQEKIAEYEEKFNNPYRAAEMGYVDDVIEPATARQRIISALEYVKHKERIICRRRSTVIFHCRRWRRYGLCH